MTHGSEYNGTEHAYQQTNTILLPQAHLIEQPATQQFPYKNIDRFNAGFSKYSKRY